VYFNFSKDWMRNDVDFVYLRRYVSSRIKKFNICKKINNDDVETFFKLRHNLFSRYCNVLLDQSDYSDISFRNFGVDSDRTPDNIISSKGKLFVLEYTVVNQRLRGQEIKGFYNKYSDEVVKHSSPIECFYLIMALDDVENLGGQEIVNTIYNLKKEGLFPGEVDESGIINDYACMRQDLFELQDLINQYIPDLLIKTGEKGVNFDFNYENEKVIPPLKLDFFNLPHTQYKIENVKSVKAMSIVNSNKFKILRNLRLMNVPEKVIIKVVLDRSQAYPVYSELGVQRDEMLVTLRNKMVIPSSWLFIVGDYKSNVEKDLMVFEEFDIDFTPSDKIILDIDHNQIAKEFYHRMNFLNFNGPREGFQDVDLVTNHCIDLQVQEALELYKDKLDYFKTQDNVIIRKKSPFIHIPPNNLKTGSFSPNLTLPGNQKITQILLDKIRLIDFSHKENRDIVESNFLIDRSDLEESILKLSREMTGVRHEIRKECGVEFELFKRSGKKEKREMMNSNTLFSQKMKEKQAIGLKIASLMKEPTRVSYKNRIQLNVNSKFYKDLWEEEKIHLRKPKGIIEIYDEPKSREGDFLNMILKLIEEMFSKSNEVAVDRVLSKTESLGINLKELVDGMYKELSNKEDDFKKLNIAQVLLFISRYCYSLMYFSNVKTNSTDFLFDNLGYSNAVLIVKGGKKIKTTKYSRLHKLIYPISLNTAKILEATSFQTFLQGDQWYVTTPWRQLKIDYLKNGLEIYHKFGNYVISKCADLKRDLFDIKPLIVTKMLAIMSQKRKFEEWLGFLRYIYFNSFGQYSDIKSLFSDMVRPDYDPLIFLYQRQFIKNYPKLLDCAKDEKLIDILTGDLINDLDFMAEKFDEHIFMTKAPFEPLNEHLKNVKSILLNHHYFCQSLNWSPKTDNPSDIRSELIRKTVIKNDDSYVCNLFSNDFNIDPRLIAAVGSFCAQEVKKVFSKAELSSYFDRSVNESFTKVSTSKGMRDENRPFWGKKGHDVVFSKVEKNITDLLNIDVSASEYNKIRQNKEKSIIDYLSDKKHFFEFDCKDKDQYKGSREIYVMSLYTKCAQNPLEEFFKKLCSAFPNELIHTQSHQRPKLLHSRVFETIQDQDSPLYATLDCRKWAPRSNLLKYEIFIKSMENALPDNFIKYFNGFWAKYYQKRLIIQDWIVEKMRKNKNDSYLLDYLREAENQEYHLYMPYSFMMGIFNYLSSLLHAASQEFFSQISFNLMKVNVNLVAHSDDSSGIFFCKDQKKSLRCFNYYEIFQKGLNHLMSRKKSVLSDKCLEMISIMYVKKRLLPMTHKFMSNISLDPKGNGYYDDACDVVGKVVSIHSNGGSLIQCYSSMLAQQELLRKAYHIPYSKYQSSIPIEFGGMWNIHPIHLIVLGSNSQTVMLDLIENDRERDFRVNFSMFFNNDFLQSFGSKSNYSIPYYITHENKLELDENNKELLHNLALAFSKGTSSHLLQYYDGLYNQDFIYSLKGIDSNQLLLATLFYPCKIIKRDDNLTKKSFLLKDVAQMFLLKSLDEASPPLSVKKDVISNDIFMNYLKKAEVMRFNIDDFNIQSGKSVKPIRYDTLDFLGINLRFETLSQVLSVMEEPKILKILPNRRTVELWRDYLVKVIPGDTTNKIKTIRKMITKNDSHVRSAYLSMPSGIIMNTPEKFWTSNLLYNTYTKFISNKKVQLFTIQKFSTIGSKLQNTKHLSILQEISLNLFKQGNLNLWADKIISNISDCKNCHMATGAKYILENFIELYKKTPQNFIPNIPYAIYNTEQQKGLNVWYGQCDFTIILNNNTVKHVNNGPDVFTYWYCESEENLTELYEYYLIFTDSRGIYRSNLICDNTGLKPRLGMNDYNNAVVINPGQTAIYLSFSEVILAPGPRYLVNFVGKNFYSGTNKVEFIMDHCVDINEEFYKLHNLKNLKSLLYDETLTISKGKLKNNFAQSKINKILLNDPDQCKVESLNKKYNNNSMLANHGSFTRSLAIADNDKISNYKTAVNINYDGTILDFKTFHKLPILDMYYKAPFSRLKFFERRVLEKVIEGEPLKSEDIDIFGVMFKKFGLGSMIGSMVVYQHTFKTMNAGDINNIPINIIMDSTENLFKSIFTSFKSSHIRNFPYHIYPFPLKNLTRSIKRALMDEDLISLTALTLSGAFRAKVDNIGTFWDQMRENPYTAVLNFNISNIGNLTSIIKRMFSYMKDEGVLRDLLSKSAFLIKARTVHYENNEILIDLIDNKRIIDGPLVLDNLDPDEIEDLEEFEDTLTSNLLDIKRGDIVVKNSELIDEIMYDDFVDVIENFEENQDWSERSFKGGDLEIFVGNFSDLYEIQEFFLFNICNTITLYHDSGYLYLPGFNHFENGLDKEKGLFFTRYGNKGKEIDAFKSLLMNFKITKHDIQETEEISPVPLNFDVLNKEEMIKRVFEEQGIYKKDWIKFFVPVSDNFNQIIEKMIQNLQDKGILDIKAIIEQRRQYRSKQTYIPGFSGLTKDKELIAELRSFFGDNYTQVLTGQVNLTKALYIQYKRELIRCYKIATKHGKMVTHFLLSVLVDANISDSNDDWLINVISTHINEINEDDDKEMDSQDVSLQNISNDEDYSLEYEESDIY